MCGPQSMADRANADWDLLDRVLGEPGGDAPAEDDLEIPADLLARMKPSKRG